MTDALHIVLCEARESGPEQRAIERKLADTLANHPGIELAVLPHLYDLAPKGEGVLYLQSIPGNLVVLGWLYPRAAYWVLRANGIEGTMGHTALVPDEEVEPIKLTPRGKVPKRTIWCIDLREHHEPNTIFREIERIAGQTPLAELTIVEKTSSRAAIDERRIEESVDLRWYPVIDYKRCENCLECLNFCLFGAYGLDADGRVFVEQPDACRDGCPACSRVCPRGAILFPEYEDSAIAGGPASAGKDEQPSKSKARKPDHAQAKKPSEEVQWGEEGRRSG